MISDTASSSHGGRRSSSKQPCSQCNATHPQQERVVATAAAAAIFSLFGGILGGLLDAPFLQQLQQPTRHGAFESDTAHSQPPATGRRQAAPRYCPAASRGSPHLAPVHILAGREVHKHLALGPQVLAGPLGLLALVLRRPRRQQGRRRGRLAIAEAAQTAI